MLRILLIRPGATEYERQGRVQGTLDIPLCADGRREVEQVVEELRSQSIDAIYHNPCQSADETAAALAEALGLKSKSLDALHNLDHGLWQGMSIADIKAKQPKVYRQWQEQPEKVCPPQGETIGESKERVQALVAKLLKKHKSEGLIAIVAPEPLASVIRHVLRHDELGDLWQSGNGSPQWELIDVPQTAAAG